MLNSTEWIPLVHAPDDEMREAWTDLFIDTLTRDVVTALVSEAAHIERAEGRAARDVLYRLLYASDPRLTEHDEAAQAWHRLLDHESREVLNVSPQPVARPNLSLTSTLSLDVAVRFRVKAPYKGDAGWLELGPGELPVRLTSGEVWRVEHSDTSDVIHWGLQVTNDEGTSYSASTPLSMTLLFHYGLRLGAPLLNVDGTLDPIALGMGIRCDWREYVPVLAKVGGAPLAATYRGKYLNARADVLVYRPRTNSSPGVARESLALRVRPHTYAGVWVPEVPEVLYVLEQPARLFLFPSLLCGTGHRLKPLEFSQYSLSSLAGPTSPLVRFIKDI